MGGDLASHGSDEQHPQQHRHGAAPSLGFSADAAGASSGLLSSSFNVGGLFGSPFSFLTPMTAPGQGAEVEDVRCWRVGGGCVCVCVCVGT